jgi:hypothetical protein
MPSATVFYPGVSPVHRDIANAGTGSALLEANNLSDVQSVTEARDNLGINATLVGTLFAAWVAALPTAPSATPGWWSNSGIPNYS